MTVLFISDLHLDSEQPDAIQLFCDFISDHAEKAEALYILGDFVEYWIGDDDPAPNLQSALSKLKDLSQKGIPCYLMHGNRDFLIGDKFAQDYGIKLLSDPTTIELYGKKLLLMHGDLLCTDDVPYQEFRKLVRSSKWQANFLSQSLEDRHKAVLALRAKSKEAMAEKESEIMDVNQDMVMHYMQDHQVDYLIHGHTHRPNVHHNNSKHRLVLGDWYDSKISYLSADKQGLKLYHQDKIQSLDW